MDSVDTSTTSDRGLEPNGHVEEDVVSQVQTEIANIAAFAQLAAAARDDAKASQDAAATAAAQATTKSAEINAIAEAIAEARDSAIASQSAAATAATQAQAKFDEVNANAQAAASARDAAKESQTAAATAAIEAQTKSTEIAELATQAQAAHTKITDHQTVVATKSEHIEGARRHVDKVRAEVDATLVEATQKVTEAEGLRARAQSAANTATDLLGQVKSTKSTIDTEASEMASALQLAQESAETAKTLAEKSETIEARINEYESQLAQLKEQSAAQLQEITRLLPGATAAGISTSWNERRQTFLDPQKRWQWVFVGSLTAIIILALTGLLQIYFTSSPDGTTGPQNIDVLSVDHLLRVWLARLPVAAALVWLALHASRESALAKRLEEDYGFKATSAAAFVGLKDLMSSLPKDVDKNSPLARLCENTLTTIATPPGRIYDKHKLVTTPLGEVTNLIDATGKAAKGVRPNIPGM